MIASPSPIEFPSAATLAEDLVSILNVASESNLPVIPIRSMIAVSSMQMWETVAKMAVRRYLGETGIVCADMRRERRKTSGSGPWRQGMC
jgi:hypothetical protein